MNSLWTPSRCSKTTQRQQAISSKKFKSPSALILDRDGTLNAMVMNGQGVQDSPYFYSQLVLYPNLGSLLKPWVEAKIPLFIVTNQPGIAKGNFTEMDLARFHSELAKRLEAQGIKFREIISCTHHPVGTPFGDRKLIVDCECRKPKPGMFHELERKHGIDLSKAIYVGDSEVDRKAAEVSGVGEFLAVRTFVSDEVPAQKRVIGFPEAPSLEHALQNLCSP